MENGVIELKPIVEVLSQWDRGVIHGLSWLLTRGMDRVQAHRSCAAGELRRIGSGVFMRPQDRLHWCAAVEAMQVEFGYPVHIGGLSALEQLGTSHNVPLSRSSIQLITYKNWNLPLWVRSNDWGIELKLHRSRLFKGDIFLMEHEESGFHVSVSSRETAILEHIDASSYDSSYESLENLLQGLRTMRTVHLQSLLEGCTSSKVKRIFLYVSEKLEMPYFSRLDLSRIDLGRGSREVVKGGRWDSKYRITVPHEVEGSEF